jgi:hypothetical protein
MSDGLAYPLRGSCRLLLRRNRSAGHHVEVIGRPTNSANRDGVWQCEWSGGAKRFAATLDEAARFEETHSPRRARSRSSGFIWRPDARRGKPHHGPTSEPRALFSVRVVASSSPRSTTGSRRRGCSIVTIRPRREAECGISRNDSSESRYRTWREASRATLCAPNPRYSTVYS